MKKEVEDKVKDIIDTKFEVETCNIVPDIKDTRLTFSNKGLEFDAVTLFIDMRGSTKVLNNHNRTSVAKLHMAYFHTIVKIAKHWDGEVRSFNGDGMLVFFYGNYKEKINNAVQAAMQMKYMLTQTKVNSKMANYTSIDFGIGLDCGKIICTKVGIPGGNNRDLVWIGNAVNKSVKIGDRRKSPNQVGISKHIYNSLDDNHKYHTIKGGGFFGGDKTVNMWEEDYMDYNDSCENYYYTSYNWTVN